MELKEYHDKLEASSAPTFHNTKKEEKQYGVLTCWISVRYFAVLSVILLDVPLILVQSYNIAPLLLNASLELSRSAGLLL